MPELVWLITGCSSGFGKQFVHSILARGDKVIATGRRLEKLQPLEASGAAVLQLDVTDPQQKINSVMETAIQLYGKIDVLINNAGSLQGGFWEDLQYEDYLSQFQTNVFGTIKVTQAILPHLRARRTGTLAFIGSLSGWIGHGGVSAYAGSKFALEGIVESLRLETEPLGIKTLLIEPGRFRTDFLNDGNMKFAQSTIPDYMQSSQDFRKVLAADNRKQNGDTNKLVEIVLDMIRHEGVAAGKDVPFRLPLGPDVYHDIEEKCHETLRLLKSWESVIKSTDHEE